MVIYRSKNLKKVHGNIRISRCSVALTSVCTTRHSLGGLDASCRWPVVVRSGIFFLHILQLLVHVCDSSSNWQHARVRDLLPIFRVLYRGVPDGKQSLSVGSGCGGFGLHFTRPVLSPWTTTIHSMYQTSVNIFVLCAYERYKKILTPFGPFGWAA